MTLDEEERRILRVLSDKDAIATELQRYPQGIDGLDTARFVALFTDEIELDLESWSGRPAARVRPTEWADDLMSRLAGFDGTQHMLSHPNVVVDADRASTRPEIVAMHFMIEDGDRRMHAIGGHYEHRWRRTDQGWKVEALRLTVRWEMGDRALFARAWARQEKRRILP